MTSCPTDPRYPDAIEPDAPEFANDRERADYYEALAKSYAAKITAIKHVLASDWRLTEDRQGRWWAEKDEPVGAPGSIDNPDGFR